MKKIVAIILVLITALSVCACDSRKPMPEMKENVGRPVTEPTVGLITEPTTEEETEAPTEEQQAIAVARPYNPNNTFYNSTNYEGAHGEVNVNIRRAAWENGELYVECFIINNLDVTVTTFTLERFTISNEEGLIADGTFSKAVSMRIAPHTYTTHTYHFLPDSVFATNANLQDLLSYAKFAYTYES